MKTIAFILSLYILSLNFVMCADVHEKDNMSKIAITGNLEGDHGHTDSDLCSPFCICQCCQINLVTINFLAYKIISPEMYASIFFRNNVVEQEVTYSILQPPQV